VTVFGVIDVNVRAVRNDAWVKTVSNDGIGASALGFRGSEDLGGGLRAEFWIEGQLTADVGGPTPFNWRRRSTVALAGSFGEVRLGRDYTPTYWNLAQYEPWRGLGVGNANNLEPIAIPRPPLGSATTTLVRADNAVVYLTPAGMAPWQVHLMVAAGEGTPGNKYMGGRLRYTSGPFDASVAAGRTQGDAADNDFDVVNAGAAYNFGAATVSGMVQQMKYLQRRQRNMLVGLTVPVGVGEVRASWQRADQSGVGTDADDATQLALGYVHHLSKRTALYATGSRVTNRGKQVFRRVVQRRPALARQRLHRCRDRHPPLVLSA
jgi:predicted porin